MLIHAHTPISKRHYLRTGIFPCEGKGTHQRACQAGVALPSLDNAILIIAGVAPPATVMPYEPILALAGAVMPANGTAMQSAA